MKNEKVYREYYRRNREKILKRQKLWHKNKYANDPEYRKRQIERSKKRYLEHKKEILEYCRKWRLEHSQQCKTYYEKSKKKLKPKTKKKEIKPSVSDQHKKSIAIKTLKMSDVAAKLMGGMSKEEAKKFLELIGMSKKDIENLESPDKDADDDEIISDKVKIIKEILKPKVSINTSKVLANVLTGRKNEI